MLRNLYAVLAISLLFLAGPLVAQTGSGTLKGKVTDKKTGEPLPFANVVVLAGESQVGGGATDFDGQYTVKPIAPGQYNVKVVFVGYNPQVISGVVIQGDKITFQDLALESGVNLEEVIVVDYVEPLIDRDGGSSGGTVSRSDIDKMSARSATAVASTVGGISDAGNGEGNVSVRGARSENTFYYIDGIKVRGSTNLPKSAIEEVSVITGGIPANYGDATGGIISITTRGASSVYFGGIDLLSSGFKAGDDIIGLDAYGRTQLEGFLSGPLAWRKDAEGNKTQPLLGFFLSGNYRRFEDQRPSAIGNWYLTDEADARLRATPQTLLEGGNGITTMSAAESLTSEDFVNEDLARNADLSGGSLTAKLDFNLNENATISIGGTGAYSNSNDYDASTANFENQLLNYANNSTTEDLDWRAFARFTQRFKSAEESKIKNAYYTLSLDYTNTTREIKDRNHQENYFKYGHVGKFFTTRSATIGPGSNNPFLFEQTGDSVLVVGFEPGSSNPVLSNVTQQYLDRVFMDVDGVNLETDVRGSALANGDFFDDAYGLFTNIGTPFNSFQKSDNNQFRVTTSGSADLGDHAISIGIEYEQRTDRFFSIAPVRLWQRMRQLTNSHIDVIDPDSPRILLPNDPDNPEPGYYIQLFDPLVNLDAQNSFDRSVRTSLGLDPDGDDFINIDQYDPDMFTLDMFSAEDLLLNGSNLVNYAGYDFKGDRLSSDPSIDDFFNAVDEFGNPTAEIAPFRPVYVAGYIMDKFAFDDIIFNVGVRVDRFDANQKVLRDEYIVGDFFTAGEAEGLTNNGLPAGIDSDYAVYVNTNDGAPTSVQGYRNGDTWYDANGSQVLPSQLQVGVSSFPYLKNAEGYSVQNGLNADAFVDYDPVISVMPRVAFSFPISDEAVFFAHYDILTQRPTTGVRLELIDYQFIQAQDVVINNANLQPTKTIDYELGFQQVLSRSSSLKISGFYRDMRDMIQVRALIGAWPERYTTYRNIDFGTVKGLTLSYDLRRTGNVRMNANYTLQFASGTGSNSTGALNLANSGAPNLQTINPLNFDQRHAVNVTLDYRYGSGSDYNGPVWFGKQVLSNTGLNLIANLGSGTPYSSILLPRNVTATGANGLEGSLNGSRLPGTFTLDAQVDKNISLTFGKDKEGDKAKTANLNVYLLITNVLNTQNIRSVYGFTGSPDDDGFLATNQAQNLINSAPNPESYRDYYRVRLADPYNYGRARTISLGVKLDF